MWLFGEEEEVTEVGTMNQFFFWEKADGSGRELVTAPLDSGTILPGVTRDSVLNLVRGWGGFEVSERVYTMKEVMRAIEDGRMIEAFGCGTAVIVAPVEAIGYNGKDYSIPLDPSNSENKAGPLTHRIYKAITDIQYGRLEHEGWSIVL